MTYNISVVIPLYNKENEITRCLESILAQDYQATEILIIDNLSTDQSVEKAKNYVNRTVNLLQNNFVKFYTCDKKGPGLARNMGFSLASGTYVAFLDADDIWCKNHLSDFVEVRRAHPSFSFHYTSSYAHSFFGKIGRDRNLRLPNQIRSYSEFFKAYFFNRSMICSSTAILEKGCITGDIYPGISHEEDLLVWPSLVECVPLFTNSNITAIIDKTPVSETSSSVRVPQSILWRSEIYRSDFWGRLCAARRLVYVNQVKLALIKLPFSLCLAMILEIGRIVMWRAK